MRTVEIVNTEIQELKDRLASVKGTDTEVYTRIVGYYRSVRNWNKGKRDEYNHRKLFSQPGSSSIRETAETAVNTASFFDKVQPVRSDLSDSQGEPVSYLYFYRTTCPNCPPVKTWLENIRLCGKMVNVDEKAGFEVAAEYQIYSSPTVVFLDSDGIEMYRANTVDALDALLSTVPA
ncbi:MAG: hypothetical protein JEZ04_03665 [Spirochaetales bacterium]|nr:hypothetical protein [Spirochaetales bacterium]